MAILATEFANRPRPQYDWLIQGLLTRKNTGFMIGQAKLAKSWLLLAAAWNLSEGKPIWGVEHLKPSRPLRVIYFTQEDTEDNIHDRMLAHMGAGRELSNMMAIVPKDLSIAIDTPEGREKAKRHILDVVERAGPVDLVIFDPMRNIYYGSENDSQVIADLMHQVERIQNQFDCGVLISHHTVKPPLDRTGWDPTDPYTGRGSGAIYGSGDAFVVVNLVEDSPDGGKTWRRVSVHFQSKRGPNLDPMLLEVNFQTGQVTCLGRPRPRSTRGQL